MTDGRTDRQTDRILITIPRLHYMQRGKNDKKINYLQDELNVCLTCLQRPPRRATLANKSGLVVGFRVCFCLISLCPSRFFLISSTATDRRAQSVSSRLAGEPPMPDCLCHFPPPRDIILATSTYDEQKSFLMITLRGKGTG